VINQNQIAQIAFLALLIRIVVMGSDLGMAVAFVGSCLLVVALEVIRLKYTPEKQTTSQADIQAKVEELEHRLSSMAVSIAFKPVHNPLGKRNG
jgi:hypothetical protein